MQQQALDDQYEEMTQEMAQELATKFDLADLLKFISHELPKLNFKCCMLSGNFNRKKNNTPIIL